MDIIGEARVKTPTCLVKSTHPLGQRQGTTARFLKSKVQSLARGGCSIRSFTEAGFPIQPATESTEAIEMTEATQIVLSDPLPRRVFR